MQEKQNWCPYKKHNLNRYVQIEGTHTSGSPFVNIDEKVHGSVWDTLWLWGLAGMDFSWNSRMPCQIVHLSFVTGAPPCGWLGWEGFIAMPGWRVMLLVDVVVKAWLCWGAIWFTCWGKRRFFLKNQCRGKLDSLADETRIL